MYAFLSPSDCHSRILIHGNCGNHKESSILAEQYSRSEKSKALESQTTIFLSLKLTPDDAHVSTSLFFSPSSRETACLGFTSSVLFVLSLSTLPQLGRKLPCLCAYRVSSAYACMGRAGGWWHQSRQCNSKSAPTKTTGSGKVGPILSNQICQL
jgi:hypothetical protein